MTTAIACWILHWDADLAPSDLDAAVQQVQPFHRLGKSVTWQILQGHKGQEDDLLEPVRAIVPLRDQQDCAPEVPELFLRLQSVAREILLDNQLRQIPQVLPLETRSRAVAASKALGRMVCYWSDAAEAELAIGLDRGEVVKLRALLPNGWRLRYEDERISLEPHVEAPAVSVDEVRNRLKAAGMDDVDVQSEGSPSEAHGELPPLLRDIAEIDLKGEVSGKDLIAELQNRSRWMVLEHGFAGTARISNRHEPALFGCWLLHWDADLGPNELVNLERAARPFYRDYKSAVWHILQNHQAPELRPIRAVMIESGFSAFDVPEECGRTNRVIDVLAALLPQEHLNNLGGFLAWRLLAPTREASRVTSPLLAYVADGEWVDAAIGYTEGRLYYVRMALPVGWELLLQEDSLRLRPLSGHVDEPLPAARVREKLEEAGLSDVEVAVDGTPTAYAPHAVLPRALRDVCEIDVGETSGATVAQALREHNQWKVLRHGFSGIAPSQAAPDPELEARRTRRVVLPLGLMLVGALLLAMPVWVAIGREIQSQQQREQKLQAEDMRIYKKLREQEAQGRLLRPPEQAYSAILREYYDFMTRRRRNDVPGGGEVDLIRGALDSADELLATVAERLEELEADRDAYERCRDLIASGRRAKGIAALDQYLERFPSGVAADYARERQVQLLQKSLKMMEKSLRDGHYALVIDEANRVGNVVDLVNPARRQTIEQLLVRARRQHRQVTERVAALEARFAEGVTLELWQDLQAFLNEAAGADPALTQRGYRLCARLRDTRRPLFDEAEAQVTAIRRQLLESQWQQAGKSIGVLKERYFATPAALDAPALERMLRACRAAEPAPRNPRRPVLFVASRHWAAPHTARQRGLPEALAERLMKLDLPDVGRALAANPDTPPHVLRTLSQKTTWSLHDLLAANPSTPPDVLEAYATREVTQRPGAVAANPSTPPKVLRRLFAQADRGIRHFLARNPALPLDIRKELLQEGAPRTNALLAGNAGLTPEEAERLLRTDQLSVKRALARNPAAPMDLLERIAAAEALMVRVHVAGNWSTPEYVLAQLSTDPNADVRQAVAGNGATPPDVLRRLAAENLHLVAEELATNPACPVDLFESLAQSGIGVRQKLVRSLHWPDNLAQQLADKPVEALRIQLVERRLQATWPALCRQPAKQRKPSGPIWLLRSEHRRREGALRSGGRALIPDAPTATAHSNPQIAVLAPYEVPISESADADAGKSLEVVVFDYRLSEVVAVKHFEPDLTMLQNAATTAEGAPLTISYDPQEIRAWLRLKR